MLAKALAVNGWDSHSVPSLMARRDGPKLCASLLNK